MDRNISVLIVEDEKNVCDIVATTLTSKGYTTIQSYSGKDAINQINLQSPDVVLLDLLLPDMSGMEIIRNVRTFSSVPIIVLSALSDEDRKVEALDLGADDYISKPFGNSELLARIRTAVRHSQRNQSSAAPASIYRVGDLYINFEKRQIFVNEKELRLTPVEYKLVSLLAHNSGKVMTNTAIMTKIWGPYVTPDNGIIRVNIANIRRKIEENPADPKYIFTEPGIGYRMVEEVDETNI